MTGSSGSSPTGRSAEAVNAAVAEIWERLRDQVIAHVDVLDAGVTALIEGRLDEPQRMEAERAAHKLAGSAGTFGFAEASRLARGLERRFGSAPVDIDGAWQAAEDVVALRVVLDHQRPIQDATVAVPGAEPERGRLPVIALLTSDDGLAVRLARAGQKRELDVRQAATAARLQQLARTAEPAALIIDGAFGRTSSSSDDHGRASDGARTRRALEAIVGLELASEAPTLLLTDTEDQTDRVAAARAGIGRYLPRALEADGIADAVVDELRSLPVERILACDDDPASLDVITAVLERDGCVITTVQDPRTFWDVLASEPPDLVLLDIDMPHVDGLELCRTLRQDPAHASRPVMFLTGLSDRDAVQRAFMAGADDVITKPVFGPELDARVGNRLERSRLLRRLAERDPLTGLGNRRASTVALERLLQMSVRHKQPMCLAVLDVDGFKRVNDLHGHAAGDAVLRVLGQMLDTRFRAGDVAARWGGDELVVGMYGMGCHDGVQRIAELLEEVRRTSFSGDRGAFSVTFSTGIAEHPTDGDGIMPLYHAADRAMRAAKRGGGDQVRSALPEGEPIPGMCDVVVIEDDPAMSELLGHVLRTRGYEVEVLDDGGEAQRRLVGATADLHPAVILLDVDLAALNGLDLLARCAGTGCWIAPGS